MLAANLGNRRKSLETLVKRSETAYAFYQALCRGEYEIRFSFDEADSSILYEAFSPDLSNYHSLTLSLNREAVDISLATNLYSAALLLYLNDREADASDEWMKEVYGPIYAKMEPLSRLSPELASYRSEHQREFDQLSSLIVDALKPVTQVKAGDINLYFSFFNDEYENKYGVEIYIRSADKRTKVKNIPSLALAISQGGEIPLYGGKSIHVSPESFSFNQKTALQLVLSGGPSRYRPNTLSIYYVTGSQLASVLYSLKGQTVSLNAVERFIEPEAICPKLIIDNQGALTFDPNPLSGLLLTRGETSIFVGATGSIKPLEFESKAKQALFQFVVEHPHFQFDAFRHELDTNIIPLVEGEAEISPEYREKHPSQKPEIRCQIDYGEDECLVIDTDYLVGGASVSPEQMELTAIGSAKLSSFQLALQELGLPDQGKVKDQDVILGFLKADLSKLTSSCSLLLSENIAGKKLRKPGKFSISSMSGIDWLEVSLSSHEFSPDEFEAILDGYRKKKKFVRVRGEFVSLSPEDDDYGLRKAIEDFSLDETDGLDSPRLPVYQAFKLPGYESGLQVEYNEEIRKLLGEIMDYGLAEPPIKSAVKAKLRPYQLEGVKWLYVHAKRGLPGILADEMGLGKTLQTIAFLGTIEEPAPFLIVCPKSLIFNWQNEFKTWDNSIKTVVLYGSPTEREMLLKANAKNRIAFITSYDSLRNDYSFYDGIHFSVIVLDEGQNIANVYAKKTKAVKSLDASQRFVLTGTPIQNSLSDLWSIFDFMMPGYFEPYKEFNYIYGTLGEGMEATKKLLMDKIAPFILKRTKKEVLKDLPPKEEQTLIIAMNDEQRKLYDAYFEKINFSQMEGKLQILAALTRLREICVDPSIFLENAEGISEKMNVAISLIQQAIDEGHKVLVFSSFATALKHLLARLKSIGIDASFIYGDTPSQTRIELADEFNKTNKVKVMLVSLKAGGTGLNLVGADIVIHLDPWWNLAAENQASDRAHRIGQKRRVTIIKMVCKDTVEDKVLELQEIKRELASVVAEGDEALSRISLDDLRFLLN